MLYGDSIELLKKPLLKGVNNTPPNALSNVDFIHSRVPKVLLVRSSMDVTHHYRTYTQDQWQQVEWLMWS